MRLQVTKFALQSENYYFCKVLLILCLQMVVMSCHAEIGYLTRVFCVSILVESHKLQPSVMLTLYCDRLLQEFKVKDKLKHH